MIAALCIALLAVVLVSGHGVLLSNALQIMMLNNGCMCCTVKEDLLKMLFELVSGLTGALCLARIKAHLFPLCLRPAHLLLALKVPHTTCWAQLNAAASWLWACPATRGCVCM